MNQKEILLGKYNQFPGHELKLMGLINILEITTKKEKQNEKKM